MFINIDGKVVFITNYSYIYIYIYLVGREYFETDGHFWRPFFILANNTSMCPNNIMISYTGNYHCKNIGIIECYWYSHHKT